MISPLRHSLYRFSTASAIASKTFAKFQQKYAANLEAFSNKAEASLKYSDTIKRSTQKTYVHPFDNVNEDLVTSSAAVLQGQHDFYGGEQVSPHYENFGMARREAIVFWLGYLGLNFIADTPDFHFFAQAAASGWVFTFGYLYFFTEGKKSIAVPILNRFYRKITKMELANLEAYYAENVEARVRGLMAIAKSQIDYKTVHNEYVSIRNNALLSYMINEQVSLKNHLYERATNILKEAEAIETMNQNKIINEVMSETLSSIDKAYTDHKEQIESGMFKLALKGIAAGKMDYANDPILPYVISTIQKTVEKFSKISPEEQKKIVQLSKEQLDGLRNADVRARDQFLYTEPKIDGSLKNNESIAKILERWGK